MPLNNNGAAIFESVVNRLGGGLLAATRLCVIVPFIFIAVYMLLVAVTPDAFVPVWVWLERLVVSAGIIGVLCVFVRYPWHSYRPEGMTHALAASVMLVLPATVTGFWPAVGGAFITPALVAVFFIAERFRRA